MSVKNYKSAVESIGKVSNLVDQFGRTPGIQAKIALAVTGLYPVISSVAKVDFKAVKEEIKNATAEEKKEVNDAFDSSFDLVNNNLEGIVENAVDLVVEGKALFEKAKSVLGDFKALSKKD